MGPIPWMICSEIIPTEIRGIVGSAAGTVNWGLALILTQSFLGFADAVGYDTVFYIFTGMSVIGTIVIISILPETKGKTVSQIHEELSQ